MKIEQLSLLDPDSASKDTYTVNFVKPKSFLSSNNLQITLGEGNSLLIYTLLSKPTTTATEINFTCVSVDGSPVTRLSFNPLSTIPAGGIVAPLLIETIDDSIVQEPIQELNCQLKAFGIFQDEMILKIADDESVPKISLSGLPASTIEGNTNLTATIQLSAPSTQVITVDLLPDDGTAIYGLHHLFVGGQLIFQPGETLKTLNIPLLDNTVEGANTLLKIALFNADNAILDQPTATKSTTTIIDNDLLVNFASTTASVSEKLGSRWGIWPSTLKNWKYRNRFSFNHTNSTGLTNVNALIKLDPTMITYSDFKTDGSDIRIYSPDASTEYFYRLEKWNNNGESALWVNLPSLPTSASSPLTVDLYYGNPSATAPSPAGPFDADIVGYWDGESLQNQITSSVDAIQSVNGGLAAGLGGGGYSFNNLASHYKIPHHSALDVSSYTVSFWIKPTNFGNSSNWRVIALKQGAGNNRTFGFFLKQSSTSQIHYSFSSGGTYRSFNSVASLNLNAWTHVAMTYDGVYLKLYLNGTQDSSNPATGVPDKNTEAIYFGATPPVSAYDGFAGVIDEIKIHNIALSATSLLNLYESSNPGFIKNTGLDRQVSFPIGVQIANPLSFDLTVPFSVSGSALENSDFALSSNSVVIPAGQTSAPIPLQLLRDLVAESDETIDIQLGNPSAGVLGPNSLFSLTLLDFANSPPTAVADSFSFGTETPKVINALANDTDIDGDSLIITGATNGSFGTVTFTTSELVYTPQAFHPGSDSFTYTISDQEGGSHTGTITMTLSPAESFFWTGNGTNSNWNNPANWSNNLTPNSSSILYFDDNYCTGMACQSNISVSTTVAGLRMTSNFTGTISQSQSLTVNGKGFYQKGGSFNANISRLNIYYSTLEVTGGQFTAPNTDASPSAFLDLYESHFNIASATTFSANTGRIKMRSRNLWADTGTYDFNAGTHSLNDLEFGDEGGHHNIIGQVTVARDLFIIDGSCSSCTFGVMTGGTIDVGRHLSITYYGITGTSTTIRLVGALDHNIIGSTYDPGQIPSLELDTTGNVTVTNKVYLKKGFNVVNVGSFNASTARIVFATAGNNGTFSLNHNGVEFGELIFGGCGATHNVPGTLVVRGKLTIDGDSSGACGYQKVNGGEIQAYGDADFTGYGNTGNVAISFVGTNNATINIGGSHAPRFAKGLVQINKTGGAILSLDAASASWNLTSAGQSMNIVAGSLNLAGKTLTINGNLDLPLGTEITKGGGTLTYGTITPALGSGGVINP